MIYQGMVKSPSHPDEQRQFGGRRRVRDELLRLAAERGEMVEFVQYERFDHAAGRFEGHVTTWEFYPHELAEAEARRRRRAGLRSHPSARHST